MMMGGYPMGGMMGPMMGGYPMGGKIRHRSMCRGTKGETPVAQWIPSPFLK